MRKQESGVTLLELILALVIATMIITLSVQQYQVYKYDAEITQIKYNVNDVFRALGLFYQANCKENKDKNGNIIKPGVLDPINSPNDPFAVDIQSDLSANSYISPWPPFAADNIVEDYVAQFNRVESIRNIYQCYKHPLTGKVDCTVPQPTVSAGKERNVILWQAQVAIKLKNPAQADTLLRLLGANCISLASGTTGTVVPCSTSSNTGDYLVWEQLPSTGTFGQISELWPSTPRLKQINQQYTNADLDAFNEFPWASPPKVYYVCGG